MTLHGEVVANDLVNLRLEAEFEDQWVSAKGLAQSVLFRPSPTFWDDLRSFRLLVRDQLEVSAIDAGSRIHLTRDAHGALQITFRIANEHEVPGLAMTGVINIHGEFRDKALASLERALRGASEP